MLKVKIIFFAIQWQVSEINDKRQAEKPLEMWLTPSLAYTVIPLSAQPQSVPAAQRQEKPLPLASDMNHDQPRQQTYGPG